MAKTAPMQQLEVARELRARVKRARVKAVLDAAGVPPAGPDTIVITAPSAPAGEAGPGAGALAASAEGEESTEGEPLEEGTERGTP